MDNEGSDIDTSPVQAALEQLNELDDSNPVGYVAAFEQVHDVLREFLDASEPA